VQKVMACQHTGSQTFALEREKQRLQLDLTNLSQIAPVDVEREVAALAQPWSRRNRGGLEIPYTMA